MKIKKSHHGHVPTCHVIHSIRYYGNNKNYLTYAKKGYPRNTINTSLEVLQEYSRSLLVWLGRTTSFGNSSCFCGPCTPPWSRGPSRSPQTLDMKARKTMKKSWTSSAGKTEMHQTNAWKALTTFKRRLYIVRYRVVLNFRIASRMKKNVNKFLFFLRVCIAFFTNLAYSRWS